jgi:uncharacterized protein (DUF2147 family)
MEAPMKKTFYFAAAAALLMASTAAQARGISFEIEGQKIRIEAPHHCISLSCLSVTDNGFSLNMKNMNHRGRKASDVVEVASNAPEVAPPAPLPPISNNVQPVQPAQVADTAAPVSRERLSDLPAQTNVAPARVDPPAQTTQAPVVANNEPAVQQAAPPAPAPVTPLGLWATADGKANVRVEQCGANLCGYGEKNGKTSSELVLINMKPSSDHSEWTGRIHNPESGGNYDSTIAMKGPNLLRVQGCVLGGRFCGGTTWKRVS